MLITKEELDLRLKEKDKIIEQLEKANNELLHALNDLRAQEEDKASLEEPYIYVPVERECLTCPKIDLETQKVEDDDSSILITHKCKHLAFCQAIRKNWEACRG